MLSSRASLRRAFAGAWLVPGLVLAGARHSAGQEAAAPPDGAVQRTDRFERLLVETVHADSLRRWARGLGAESHVAGTEGQRATRDSVVSWMRSAGLTAAHDSLILYLPHPVELSLHQTAPVSREFDLREPPLDGTDYEHVPTFNAYSGRGTVSGEVVYANYGLPDDYARLETLGIDVRGRIVLARYGRSFRGIKAREAERRGAAGLLLYSDPDADGFERGAVLPEGPFRPPTGVQRGSVLNTRGDPSSPDHPSTPGSQRVAEAAMEGVARIPVLPIGYATARELLSHLGGPTPPPGWDGALDVAYRPGPGPTAVALTVRTESGEAAYRPAYNTVGVLPGEIWPDEWIIIGAHRDSWGPGAIDNVSGTAVVVETARAFGVAWDRGYRPARSILFATWDAEEWGIIGSTEWVEGNEALLDARAMAYINQDSPVSGSSFRAAAAPEIRGLVREASRAMNYPGSETSLYETWLAQQRQTSETEVVRPAVGTMGGGSDHLPFYIHLGIPSAGYGFGGGQGVYHSMYDTREWMERFGDPGYAFHAGAARLSAIILARLANSALLPYEHVELAGAYRTELAGFAAELQLSAIDAEGRSPALDSLREALAEYEASARWFSSVAEDVDARTGNEQTAVDTGLLAQANAAQRDALRELLAPAVDGRWERNLYVQDDPDNGYSPLLLPGLRLAVRHGDEVLLDAEARLLADRFRAAAAMLADGAALLARR